jgi:hypothetical protein
MSAAHPIRTQVLEALLRLERSPAELARDLSAFGWDWDSTPLVVLTREGALGVLRAAIDGRIPLAHVEPWADLIEGREDIGLEGGAEDVLTQVVFELANPELTDRAEEDVVREWIGRLG